MHTCQHTQVGVYILGCLLSLWMFDTLPWTWLFLFFCIICSPAMPGSSEGSVDRLCDLCDGLHGTLAEADMLGRRCKRRSGILRTLFRLIDLDSAQLNLYIAKLCLAVSCLWVSACPPLSHYQKGIHGAWALNTKVVWSLFAFFSLQLCVSGNNLLNICKLIFQISRSESNDILFQNNSIIGEHDSRSQWSSLGSLFCRKS